MVFMKKCSKGFLTLHSLKKKEVTEAKGTERSIKGAIEVCFSTQQFPRLLPS